METGKIVQILGPVIDVAFTGKLPMIKDALTVQMEHKKCVMEVAQHMGNGVVRCISLSATDGLAKDMEVTATGSCIQVPVGEETLGRMFNVLGEPIDNAGEVQSRSGQSTEKLRLSGIKARLLKFWKLVSRLSTCLHRMQRVVRLVCSAVLVLVKPF